MMRHEFNQNNHLIQLPVYNYYYFNGTADKKKEKTKTTTDRIINNTINTIFFYFNYSFIVRFYKCSNRFFFFGNLRPKFEKNGHFLVDTRRRI